MKALVTRPREDAEEIAAALASRGWEPVLEPLLAIRFAEDGASILAPLLDGAQAVLFTSANGVRAFAAASPRRDLAAFAVGDATAKAARAAGFSAVESAGGAVNDLANLVRARLKPEGGALVHAAAGEAAGDLAAALAPDGFELRRAPLYEAAAAERLSDATAALLRAREIALALFFSPRTAATFVRLAEEAGVREACRTIDAAALSPAVEAALKPLPWRRIIVAPAPTMAALLAAIDGAKSGERSAEAARPAAIEGATEARSAGSAPAPVLAERRRAGGAWWALALVLVIVLALVGAAPFWAPPLIPLLPWGQRVAQDSAALAALTQRVDALESRLGSNGQAVQSLAARLDATEQRVASSGGQALKDAQQSLAARVDALEQRVASNGSQAAIAALNTTAQGLAQRLDAMEARLGAVATGQAAADLNARLLAATANLNAALASGMPYRAELAALEALGDAKVADAVRPLKADAAMGCPSVALLAEDFRSETAPAILKAAAPAEAAPSGSLSARVMARIEGLVRIRRIGEAAAPEGDAGTAVEAARAALAKGDLAAAVEALKRLSGPAADAAQPFVAAAERRLAAQAAMDALAQALSGTAPKAEAQ